MLWLQIQQSGMRFGLSFSSLLCIGTGSRRVQPFFSMISIPGIAGPRSGPWSLGLSCEVARSILAPSAPLSDNQLARSDV